MLAELFDILSGLMVFTNFPSDAVADGFAFGLPEVGYFVEPPSFYLYNFDFVLLFSQVVLQLEEIKASEFQRGIVLFPDAYAVFVRVRVYSYYYHCNPD